MKLTTARVSAVCLGVATLCGSGLPASAISFTQPGGTMGSALGTASATGLYFNNYANYGIANDTAINRTQEIGFEQPGFQWSSGYKFLGASYSASVYGVFEDIGTHGTSYLRGVFNPEIIPLALSWDLGNNIFVSFQENIYAPVTSDVANFGAGFEQVVSISYTGNDWVLSANNIFGINTSGSGVKEPDYYNLDLTVAHNFGPWQLGAVGYGSFDLETTALNTAALGGRGTAIGLGGLLGYTFSNNIAMSLMATHQVVTHGVTEYLKDDTRVWTSLTIPIWTPPAAPTPKPVVAKY